MSTNPNPTSTAGPLISREAAEVIADKIDAALKNARLLGFALKGIDSDGCEEACHLLYRGVEDGLYMLLAELRQEEEKPELLIDQPEAGQTDQASGQNSDTLQTKVAMIRQIVRELSQDGEETAALGLLMKGRFEEMADSDNDDVTLRLSFNALSNRLEDSQLEYTLRDRIDELARLVGLEAVEVANG